MAPSKCTLRVGSIVQLSDSAKLSCQALLSCTHHTACLTCGMNHMVPACMQVIALGAPVPASHTPPTHYPVSSDYLVTSPSPSTATSPRGQPTGRLEARTSGGGGGGAESWGGGSGMAAQAGSRQQGLAGEGGSQQLRVDQVWCLSVCLPVCLSCICTHQVIALCMLHSVWLCMTRCALCVAWRPSNGMQVHRALCSFRQESAREVF